VLIWWLCEHDCLAIGGTVRGAPKYLKEQYRSRLGRPGRGRLWADERFGEPRVSPWPRTALARALGDSYGGIVIEDGDLQLLEMLPGIVTDMQLRRVM
jgi:hypothetical protein